MTGNTFYGPRSRENARLLLDAAKELGYPSSVVKTTTGGYNAPEDVVEMASGADGIEEGKTYPAPDGQEQEQEQDTTLERPNKGASREEWKNYAESIGVEVVDDDKRDGIVEKVEAKEGSN